MSAQDMAVFLNIVFTVIGFVVLYFRLGERVTKLETHLIHIMRKLGMSARSHDNEKDYVE